MNTNQILLVDDDSIIQGLLSNCLKLYGYSTLCAESGEQGLKIASCNEPEIIIIDLNMPRMDGHHVIRHLRTDRRFRSTPIIVISGDDKLQSKLDAFDSGADDFIAKPFQCEELVARISRFLQRSQPKHGNSATDDSKLICVQGARGGVGTSSIAVNLAGALRELWQAPTLIVDAVREGGQIALLLDNVSQKTWGIFAQAGNLELDDSLANKIVSRHNSGMDFVAGPGETQVAEPSVAVHLQSAVEIYRTQYEYIIVDLNSQTDGYTEEFLANSGTILFIVAPEIASVSAAIGKLKRYELLGIPPENIKIVINQSTGCFGLDSAKIESALSREIDIIIPYAPAEFINSLNAGSPFVFSEKGSALRTRLVSIAHRLSKTSHVNVPPPSPSMTWLEFAKQAESTPSLNDSHSLSLSDAKATAGLLALKMFKDLIY